MEDVTVKAILEAIHAQGEQVKIIGKRLESFENYVNKRFDEQEKRADRLEEKIDNLTQIVQSKEFKKIIWSNNILALVTGMASIGAAIINQLFFRLFP